MSLKCLILMMAAAGCSKTTHAPPAATLTPEERAQLDEIVGSLETEIAARADKRTAGVSAALSAPMPNLGGPCPITLHMPDTRRRRPPGFDPERMKREMHTIARVDLTFHEGNGPSIAHAPLVTHAKSRLATARAQPFEAAQKTLAELRDDAFWDYDIIIVEDAHVDAKLGDGEFTGGRIRGRAVLWSYPESKVLCMSQVDAGSSAKIRTSEATADLAIAVDLTQNALYQGLQALRVVAD